MLTDADRTELEQLEESLWRGETRHNREHMERVLDPAFFEFGRSGRVYSRRDSLDVPPDSLQATVPLSGFAVHEISDDVALVTYVSEVRYGSEVQRGNRSSLWTRSAGRWRLRFHQGTPLAR